VERKCISGKKLYPTQAVAEDVLIELWSKHDYPETRAPLNVYQCDECGYFHLTSQGTMNERLARYLSSNKSKLDKEASKWLDKFKNRY
jgi:hypothetical protein